MSTPLSSQKSDEPDDLKAQNSRPAKYHETLRLLFSEDPEEDETLQPFSSGMSIYDVTEPKVPGDGDNADALLGEGQFRTTEKKIQVVMERLNPIPFVPARIPLFARHEEVLRGLGLWDFVHLDFDRSIRVDLLAQLVGTYNASSFDSYVNGRRVKVSKAALGLALNLPERKRKRMGLGYSDDSLEFLKEFVFGWLLLHRDDEWVMPKEVKNWSEKICRGRLEKVDWAGLVWVMVEKELAQGEQLMDCYYASHLQCLMKWQHEELFLEEEAFEMDAGVEGNNEFGAKTGHVECSGPTNECVVEVVQDVCGDEKEDVEDVEMAMDIEKCKECGEDEEMVEGDDVEKEGEEGGGGGFGISLDDNTVKVERKVVVIMERSKVACGDGSHSHFANLFTTDDTNANTEHIPSSLSQVYDVKKGAAVEGGHDECGDVKVSETVNDDMGEGYAIGRPSPELMQGECRDEKQDMENAERALDFEKCKEYGGGASSLEDRKYVDVAMIEGEDKGEEGEVGGGDSNLVERIQGGDVTLGLHRQFGCSSLTDGTNNDIDIQHIASSLPSSHHVEKGAVVVKHDDRVSAVPLQDAMPVNFEQIHEMMERAKMLDAKKELLLNQKTRERQILLNQIQGQDAIIEHLHKSTWDEIKKKDVMIYRLERELHLKKSVLDAYKKALKETQEEFDNYVQRSKLCEKPPCKDAGQGELVLSSSDMAKIRKEEECYAGQFKQWIEKIRFLDKKLRGLVATAEELNRLLHAKRKANSMD